MKNLFLTWVCALLIGMWMLPSLALAAETESKSTFMGEEIRICPGFFDPNTPSKEKPQRPNYPETDDGRRQEQADKQERIKERNASISSKQDTINGKIPPNKETCGLKHSDDLPFLEKGDCSEAGYVITELSEPIGNPTPSPEGGDPGDKIINVYKGTCCWYADWNDESPPQQECYETRDIYAKTIDECDAAATFCSQRQWVIGSSGIGIIKLYVKQIYTFMVFTVGAIAVSTMVISGIQISVSGVSGDISAAKQRMTQAIIGMILVFFSGILLYTINPTFFT